MQCGNTCVIQDDPRVWTWETVPTMLDGQYHYVPNLGGAFLEGKELKRIASCTDSVQSWLSQDTFHIVAPLLQVWIHDEDGVESARPSSCDSKVLIV